MDLIDRQAAIDALDVLCQEHRYRIPGKRETYSQYNEAWQDALDRAEGAIGNLPSAQPGWIPVTERLPKPKEYVNGVRKHYLVQNEYGDMMVCSWDGCFWTQMYRTTHVKDKVAAWMPLPTPYRKGGQDGV